MSNDNTAAIESLRTFALAHNEIAFAHLCTAAIGNEQNPPEEWAVERVTPIAQRRAADIVSIDRHTQATLAVIQRTDTTRPDGAVARHFRP